MKYAERFDLVENSSEGGWFDEELAFLEMNALISAARVNGLSAEALSPYLARVEGEVFNRGELRELFGEPGS